SWGAVIDIESFAEGDFVGLTRAAAAEQAQLAGCQDVRIYDKDAILTLDYCEGRLNLEVNDDGTVTRARLG
ncbi:MAG: Peptidase inhibitor family, partial [Marmoricola sp.]|nr:Peptidase inhibitor family [Marmoricola sp.]